MRQLLKKFAVEGEMMINTRKFRSVLLSAVFSGTLALSSTDFLFAANVEEPVVITVNGKRELVLPDAVLSLVNSKYPGFRVPGVDDLEGEWLYEYSDGRYPWVVWGDFTGNGMIDIALMLVNDKEWKKIIVNKTTTGYEVALDDLGNQFDLGDGVVDVPQDFYMHLLKKGTVIEAVTYPSGEKDQEQITSFTAQYDCVISGVYESQLSIIYWQNGSYKRVVLPHS
jgi:hypothetical protein